MYKLGNCCKCAVLYESLCTNKVTSAALKIVRHGVRVLRPELLRDVFPLAIDLLQLLHFLAQSTVLRGHVLTVCITLAELSVTNNSLSYHIARTWAECWAGLRTARTRS